MSITVQDLGRPGYAEYGISASGAADPLSLRIGNRLLGNAENAAALEMTLLGGTFEFDRHAWIAFAGSELEHSAVWEPLAVKAGATVRCGAIRGGARCYLCVRGGFDVPLVLGSASTHVVTGIGGFEGRALRKGDILRVHPSSAAPTRRRMRVPQRVSTPVRVTAGPQKAWFGDELFERPYRVSEHSDRMGLRLEGPVIRQHIGKQLLTEGVSLGAVQVAANGQPIILFVEHQTTGGYPKVANVISADLHRIGQLRPREHVAFEPITLERAIELLREQEAWIQSLE
jgi:antagonist of KipI